jgi:hypothetical protein
MQDKDKVRYAWQSTAKYCQAQHGSAKNKNHFYMQVSLTLLLKILHISCMITFSYMMQEIMMSYECVLVLIKSSNDTCYTKFYDFYLFVYHAWAWQRLQER